MSFKSLRGKLHLSQERIAGMSGLSLRTVQRLEAGHRVGYASLRALAVALGMDVDVLERELYAMQRPTHEFIEMPRWVRRLRDGISGGMPLAGRRQAWWFEAFAMALGTAFLLAGFFARPGLAVTTLQLAGALSLACGYGISVATRVVDAHGGWETEDTASPAAAAPSRPIAARLAFHGAALLLSALFLWAVVHIAH